MFREDVPACVQTFGFGIQFPEKMAPAEEPCAGTTTDTLLFTDGSGKHPTEPAHRKCGCGPLVGSPERPPGLPTLYPGAGSQSTRLNSMQSCLRARGCKDRESLSLIAKEQQWWPTNSSLDCGSHEDDILVLSTVFRLPLET
eukprot:2113967-Amphidinium_carterae.1